MLRYRGWTPCRVVDKYFCSGWRVSPTETLFPILLLESVVNFSGRDVFSNEEFDRNALFHAPRYLLFAQLLRSAACLHTNQSRSYLNHLVLVGIQWNSCFFTIFLFNHLQYNYANVLGHLQFHTLCVRWRRLEALFLINVYNRHKSCYFPSVMSPSLCRL